MNGGRHTKCVKAKLAVAGVSREEFESLRLDPFTSLHFTHSLTHGQSVGYAVAVEKQRGTLLVCGYAIKSLHAK
ncbi:hypothetical protein A2U01_0092681, partial [Trifolium medium]|nr:hypothetical protein [Trifolium medium]